jgi:archaellum component FlaC
VTTGTGTENNAQEVDLEAAAKLIEALEQDLKTVRGDSRDIQRLRDEVETLKNVLNSPVRRHHWVKEGLHSIREVLENALDAAVAKGLKGGQYVAEIGRILGM